MNIVIDDDLATRFENCVVKARGYKKGNKKLCAQEAITAWCDKVESVQS